MMSRKDGFLALLVVVVWGLNFVVIKVGLHHMPPLLLAGLRFLLVAFPAIFFVARPKVPLTLLLGYGLTISFGQFAFLFCAIKFGMPAGLASLVLQAQAFFTMALGAFVFSERLQRKQLAGIALAIIGVLVLIEASLNGQHIAMSGFMLTLAAAFSWACGNIFNKKIMQHSPRPAVMSLVVWSALIPILPFLLSSLLLEGADHITQSLITIDMTTILSLLYLAFVATILGYGIWGTLLGRYETWRVAPLSLLACHRQTVLKKCPAKRGKEVKGVGRYNRARLIHLTYRCSRSRGEGHLADRPHRAAASHRGYFAPQVTKFVLQCHIRRR